MFWGDELRRQNLEFLKNFDAGYFQFIADLSSEHLDDATKLEKRDRQHAAQMLRVVHGQGVESLMAMMGALAQSPEFPVGWMLRYHPSDLEEVIRAISDAQPFPSLLNPKPVTWHSISTLVHSEIPDDSVKQLMTAKFASFWAALAAEFLSTAFRDEYNSLKHGFRIMSGGFSVSLGPPKPAGSPPSTPEELELLGSSEFGSFLLKAVPIEGTPKLNWGVASRMRNWNPEALMADLHLISCSLTNVVSCLRIISGFKPQDLTFRWPDSDAAFAVDRRMLNEIETLSFGPGVTARDVKPITAEVVRHGYDTATRKS